MRYPTLRQLTADLRALHSVLVLGGGTYCLGAIEPRDPVRLHPVDINPGWDQGWASGPYGHEDVPGDDESFDAVASARRLLADVPLRYRVGM